MPTITSSTSSSQIQSSPLPEESTRQEVKKTSLESTFEAIQKTMKPLKSLLELNPDSIDNGLLRLSIPMNKGTYTLPGVYKKARIHFRKNTHIMVTAPIAKNAKGQSVVSSVSIEFHPAIRIKNPQAAFEKPSKHPIIDRIKDAFSDAIFSAILVDSRGIVTPKGRVEIFRLFDSALEPHLHPQDFPPINLELKSLIHSLQNPAKPSTSKGSMPLGDLLCTLGAATQRAEYCLDLSAKSDSVTLSTHLRGDSHFTPNGELELRAHHDESRLTSGLFNLKLGAEAVVTHLDSTPALQAHVGVTGSATSKLENEWTAQAFVDKQGKEMKLKDASSVEVRVSKPLSFRGSGPVNAYVGMGPSSETGVLAIGASVYGITPSEEDLHKEPRLKPYQRIANFTLRRDLKLTLSPKNDAMREFFDPFFSIVWAPEKISDPKSPSIGAIGSPAWNEQIQAITGAPLRPGKATLLSDGIQSHPKRLDLIENAKESICLQTFIFRDDQTGRQTAEALVEAKKRGVDVRVIIDTIGNIASLKDLVPGNPVYKYLRDNGIQLAFHEKNVDEALKDIAEVLIENASLTELNQIKNLANPEQLVHFVQKIAQLAQENSQNPLNQKDRSKLLKGFAALLSRVHPLDPLADESQVKSILKDGKIDLAELTLIVQKLSYLRHRWHEKYLIVDGKEAIVGGMNIADEYLLGGTGAKVKFLGKERTAWKDVDALIEGPSAYDAYGYFSENWKELTDETLPETNPTFEEFPDNVQIQMIQSKPPTGEPHRITNFMIEALKSLQKGEKAYIENAYFLPKDGLEAYKIALIDAAKRGVSVVVLTNSPETSDLPELEKAAFSSSYRDLLKGGVELYQRTGDRTLHTKTCLFGPKLATVGSWNADNCSDSGNSEDLAAIYDENLAQKMEEMFLADLYSPSTRQISLTDIEALPLRQEIENYACTTFDSIM